MTIDWTGVAAVIIAVGSIIDRLFTQWNVRRPLKEAALQRERIANEAKATLDAQNEVLGGIKENTDGILNRAKIVGDKALEEVERVAKGGRPTPYGEPSAENPVTLSAGKAVVTRPVRDDERQP